MRHPTSVDGNKGHLDKERAGMKIFSRLRTASRRVRAALVVVAMLIGGGVAAVAVASPAKAKADDCPDGYICFWEHFNYDGNLYKVKCGDDTPKFDDFNDEASSATNKTRRKVHVFIDAEYGGAGYTIGQRQKYASFGNPVNDNISSLKWDVGDCS
jgi:Peptidase inhibitor family I36